MQGSSSLAFGNKADGPSTRALLDTLIADGIPGPASVRVVESGGLGPDALGAYAAEGGGTLYLDASLFDDTAMLQRVVDEEIGHHLDALLGGVDSAGDEGAVFALAMRREAPTGNALASLKLENDHVRLFLDGHATAVERYVVGEAAPASSRPPPNLDQQVAESGAEYTIPRAAELDNWIGALLPTASTTVRASLVDSVLALETAREASLAGTIDSPALVAQLHDTNNLLQNAGIETGLSRNKHGRITWTTSQRVIRSEQRDETVVRSYRLTDDAPRHVALGKTEELLATIERQGATIERRQYDGTRGFELNARELAAVDRVERALQTSPTNAAEREALVQAIIPLNGLQFAALGQAKVNLSGGRFFHADILPPDSARGVWTSVDRLSAVELAYAGRALTAELLGRRQDESGTARQRVHADAIEALAGGEDATRRPIERDFILLERAIATRGDVGGRVRLEAALRRVDARLVDLGAPSYLEQELGELRDDTLLRGAKTLLERPMYYASQSDLSQIDRFDGHRHAHDASFETLMNAASPPGGFRAPAPSEPTFATLLQQRVAFSDDPESSKEFKRLASVNFDLASHVYTGSGTGISTQDLRALHGWISGTSVYDLGFSRTEQYSDRDMNSRTRDLGENGNFGAAKMRFARAWLNTSRADRLAYLGMDPARWASAEGFIVDGIQATRHARVARKAAFGFDDLVMTGIAMGAGYVTGGLATGLVGPLLTTGAAPTLLGTTLTNSAGAGVASFFSTMVLTRGDLDASLEAGWMGALSAGLGSYVENLTGPSGVVGRALLEGVSAEATGGTFRDGVLGSLTEQFGEGLSARIEPHLSDFFADFTGHLVASTIRHGGRADGIATDMERFIRNYAADAVSEKLVAIDSERYASLFETVDDVVRYYLVDAAGDLDQLRDYLGSPAFLSSLGSRLGDDVSAWVGDEDSFAAQLAGGMTNLIIASGGDPEAIRRNAPVLALTLAGETAGRRATGLVNERLGRDTSSLGEFVGGLVGIAIASDGDPGTIAGAVFGDLANRFRPEELLGVDRETFLGGMIGTFADTWRSSGGDPQAISEALVAYAADAGVAEARRALDERDPADTIPAEDDEDLDARDAGTGALAEVAFGNRGPAVEALQARLDALGFTTSARHADGSYDGTFSHATAGALKRFQDAEIAAIDALLPEVPAPERATMTGARARLVEERGDDGVMPRVGAETLRSLATPHTGRRTDSEVGNATDIAIGPIESGLAMDASGPAVAGLQSRLAALGHDPGAIDGEFGPGTLAALNRFRDAQLTLLDGVIAAYATHAPEDPAGPASSTARLAIDAERGRGVVGPATLALLEEPLTEASVDARIAVLDGRAESPEYIVGEVQKIIADDGFVDAALFGRRTLSRAKMADVSELLGRADGELAGIVARLDSSDIDVIAANIDVLSGPQQTAFLAHLAEHLSDRQLGTFALRMNVGQQAAFVHAVGSVAPAARRDGFIDAMKEARAKERGSDLGGLNPADRKVVLDVTQLGLDIAGIFDPTIFSDGTSALISLARGNLFDAAISAVSLLPLGDAAKLLKIDRYVKTLESAIDLALRNPRARRFIDPLLDGLRNTLDPLRGRLPEKLDRRLNDLLARLDAPDGTSFHRSGRAGDGANPLLNQKPHERIPNHTYNVEGRTLYTTDSRGRVVEMDATVTSDILPGGPARNDHSQRTTVQDGGHTGFDDGGHLQSRANGGAGERINLVPLERALNRGQRDRWRAMEDMINEEAKAGRTVQMKMDLEYGSVHAPDRPTRIKVTITIDGRPQDVPFTFKNLAPEI